MNARFRAYRIGPLEPGWFLIMKGLPVRRHHSPHKGGGLRVWMGPYEGYYPCSYDSLSLLGLAELGHPVVPRGEALCARQWRYRQFDFFFSRGRIKIPSPVGVAIYRHHPGLPRWRFSPFRQNMLPGEVYQGWTDSQTFF